MSLCYLKSSACLNNLKTRQWNEPTRSLVIKHYPLEKEISTSNLSKTIRNRFPDLTLETVKSKATVDKFLVNVFLTL